MNISKKMEHRKLFYLSGIKEVLLYFEYFTYFRMLRVFGVRYLCSHKFS